MQSKSLATDTGRDTIMENHNNKKEKSNEEKVQVSMYQAATLYELSYNIKQQEELELHAEFTMAMINNLGHVYRSRGLLEESDDCFRYLLSTHIFLQAYGRTEHIRTQEFIASITYLILQDFVAPIA